MSSGYNTYTTSDLVANIKLIAHVPTGDQTFTAANVINLATREIQLSIMKQILSTRGGYYLTYEDQPIVDSGLYLIPSGAIAGALANVEMVQDTSIIPVNQIEESEQFSTISPTSTSYGYFMRGNFVQILPTPNIGTVRLWFTKRTSVLVPTSQAAVITAINGVDITVSSVPSTIVTGDNIDLCGDQPPFNVLGSSDGITITGTTITLSEEIDGLAVGDWVCLRDQTCVPQIPVEYRVLLEQRVACKIYELQGYLDKLAAAKNILKELEADTLSLITPRVKSQTKVINPVTGGFFSGSSNRMTNFPAGRN